MVAAATAKLQERMHMRTHGTLGQPIIRLNYSLMNKVYETHATYVGLLFQYRVKIGRLNSRESFVD